MVVSAPIADLDVNVVTSLANYAVDSGIFVLVLFHLLRRRHIK